MIMKIAVASNLHGNLLALSAMLGKIEKLKEDGENIEKVYVLGIFGFFPYAKEVYELISGSGDYIKAIRGIYDHAIARYSEDRENLNQELTEIELKAVEWNYESLGREGRKWIRNYVPAFVAEKYGDNEFFMCYGSPFDLLKGEVLPSQPTAYYETILSPIRKYEMLAVAGNDRFVVETKYGKIVCPGVIGYYRRGEKPSFAVIDTRNLDVYFEEVEFRRSEVEERIKAEKLPEEFVNFLYHGKL